MGRYERNEVSPSVEIAQKIADILDISLDYLIGKVNIKMDKDIQKLILEVSKFEDRKNIYSVIEAIVAKRKIKPNSIMKDFKQAYVQNYRAKQAFQQQ